MPTSTVRNLTCLASDADVMGPLLGPPSKIPDACGPAVGLQGISTVNYGPKPRTGAGAGAGQGVQVQVQASTRSTQVQAVDDMAGTERSTGAGTGAGIRRVLPRYEDRATIAIAVVGQSGLLWPGRLGMRWQSSG